MRNTDSNPRARDWDHWFYLHREEKPKKSEVAQEIGVHPSFFSKLLDPNRYQPLVDDALADRIAAMWNQPRDYVRKLYPRAA